MNGELMVQALCWEFQAKIPVAYACANRELHYFCPDPMCLRDVHAAQVVNRFFRAETGHVGGCVHEKAVGRSAQKSNGFCPPPAQAITPTPPTFLGAFPKPRRMPKPSEAEKRALALAPAASALKQAGTLDEVIDAWIRMTKGDRHKTPLNIDQRKHSYDSAFRFLASLDRSPNQLVDRDVVIFGAADIEVGRKVVFIKSVKRFVLDGQAKRLRFQLPLDAGSAADIAELKGKQTATLFWRGAVADLNGAGADIIVPAPRDHVFDGLVIRRGLLS